MLNTSATTSFLARSPHGFSNIVEVSGGRLVFVTGQMALDSTGSLVGEGDLETQLVQVFENLKSLLSEVGADFHHVVKIDTLAETSFAEQAYIFGEVRDRYVNVENPPASSITLAPRLVHPGALVDIALTVHLPLEA